MAYRKDSGEKNFLRNVNSKQYSYKKNKSIFKKYALEQISPPVTDNTGAWDIPGIDDIEVPELDIDINNGFKRNRPKKEETPQMEEFNGREFYAGKGESQSGKKYEGLSLINVIVIVALNIFIPVIGGVIFYIFMIISGKKQKAAQSIVLSAIVTIIRLMYLYRNDGL